MNLFSSHQFVSNSGLQLSWKIDCDALSKDDWDTLAMIYSENFCEYGLVYGIPTGGLAFGRALLSYATPGCKAVLIADDVLTTGRSMEEMRKRLRLSPEEARGVVVFSRGPWPKWVIPLFVLSEKALHGDAT